ncbi:trypsin-like serine peptidase [Mycobacterium sp.]|uniref:trypsin-like serine peptidase n=1 Tax=Mycobacterium sp. TaxID=1785 RepID=UPI00333FB8E4
MRVSAAGRTVLAITLLLAVTAACTRAGTTEHPTTAAPLLRQPATAPATAQPVQPDPEVGAVFLGGGSFHTCSGAVLDSAGGDLILTAAHCLADGVDATFVAGFSNDAAPEDVWHLDAVYLDPRWMQNQDPMADFAIARVSREAGGTIVAEAGGGLTLGSAPNPGTVVTVTGYPMGEGGGPIACRGPTVPATQGFPSLPCEGLVDGFSGAPWVTGSTVTGLVGGLDGGGCEDKSSYSPPFDDAITGLLRRAEAGGPADDPPTVFNDGCD